MKTLANYSVQIIGNTDAPDEALHIRYKIYKMKYSKYIQLQDRHFCGPFESDEYDKRSIHLGLYAEEKEVKKLIGYSRLIVPPFFSVRFAPYFIKDHPHYAITTKPEEAIGKIASQDHLPSVGAKHKLVDSCDDFEIRNLTYCETSRFVVDEHYRTLVIASLFVSGMIAIVNLLGFQYSFAQCSVRHRAFYEKFGFEKFPGLESFFNIFSDKQSLLLIKNIPQAAQSLPFYFQFTKQFKVQEKITFSRAA